MKKLKNKNKPKNNKYRLKKVNRYTNFENTNITFLDPHKYMVFKYVDIYTFTLTTLTGTNQIMNLNSIFDPDRTGTGHQPYGYDQMSALYNRYRVLKTKYNIKFHAESFGFYIVVVPSNGNLATTITNQASFTLACETPRAKHKVQGMGAQSVSIGGQINLNDLNGVTIDEYLADDRFQAVFSSSPGELLLLNVGLFNPSGSTLTIDFILELEFFVDIHDPILVAQSKSPIKIIKDISKTIEDERNEKIKKVILDDFDNYIALKNHILESKLDYWNDCCNLPSDDETSNPTNFSL